MREARESLFGRLTRRSEFLAAARGRRFHSELVTLQGLKRMAPQGETAPGGFRVGLTVTKRVGQATERNRIKRRLRRAVAEAIAASPLKADLDIVVVARRPCLDSPYPALVSDLVRGIGSVSAAKPTSPRSSETRPDKRPSHRQSDKPRPDAPTRRDRGSEHA